MLKPIALAHAATTVGGVAFALCGLLAYVAPDILLSIANIWFHSVNLEAIRAAEPMSLGTFIVGIITFSAYIWALTFAGASLCNKWAK
ncbi:hypothetical protein A3B02_02380 [Candidatus Roizmanbacteria bacterium RIFCSPLOWO2_01_FULL_42_14]|uniref:DUF2062 domain-containing protein n=2 Tax=Candidatus Roizmaniibacteriota TaxID=1752723 RepID=A0A1F7JX82_9BACT|nr:MAG: hypothetical protein A3B02_02380 [Candidatus Roizmanbacteria bacterium RIFCSPLOWO2_01_FULL_42_14]OGK60221.1 MAG: hypothetical protein A3I56_00110 [Candidatus Roizmanbacteria bacterium RIFCSPLOWO2_02_FULL_43_10]